MGFREVTYDAGGATPTWTYPAQFNIKFYGPVLGDAANIPQLVVTYTTGVIVTTNPADYIGYHAATLHGTLTNDGGATCTCGFDYGETIAYGLTVEATGTFITGQTFSKQAADLKPGTTYHFRARGNNGSETGYGGDLTFKTLGTIYPAIGTTRVSSLVHRYSPGNRNYTLEVVLGGLSSVGIVPTMSKRPTPSMPTDLPVCAPGYTLTWSADRGYFCVPYEYIYYGNR